MGGSTRRMMLAVCTAGLLGGSVLALPLSAGEKLPGARKRLEHLVTVRCGNTPLTDEKARKFVRVIDPEGRGVKDWDLYLWVPAPKAPVTFSRDWFSTDRFGMAEVKESRGSALEISTGAGTVTLSGDTIRFPVEVVTSAVEGREPGEKQAPPWGREHLRQVLVVRTGTDTELSGRKVVRVLDRAGRGVRGVKVTVGFSSSKRVDSYQTNQDGVAVLTRGQATA